MHLAAKRAYAAAVSRGGEWDTTVVVNGDEVMVFPMDPTLGDSPVLVRYGRVEFLPSCGDGWPAWYWDVCEDDDHYVTVE